jgi:hypothetical protein
MNAPEAEKHINPSHCFAFLCRANSTNRMAVFQRQNTEVTLMVKGKGKVPHWGPSALQP